MAPIIDRMSGMLTRATNAPTKSARPPNSSSIVTDHAASMGWGTPTWCSNFAKLAGPLLHFAQPWAMKPNPMTSRSAVNDHARILLLGELPQVLAVAFGLQAIDRDEPKGRRIHAVAEAGGCWSVVEHVSQVRVRVRRANLGAIHHQRAVAFGLDVRWLEGLGEARPPGAGLELVERRE